MEGAQERHTEREHWCLGLWSINTSSDGSVEFPGCPSRAHPPPTSCWRGRSPLCASREINVSSHQPLPAGKTDATHQPCGVLLCQLPGLHLVQTQPTFESCSMSSYSNLREVCHGGWRRLSHRKDVRAVWTTCSWCVANVKWNALVSSVSETHFALQHNRLRACLWPVTLPQLKDISLLGVVAFLAILTWLQAYAWSCPHMSFFALSG